MTKIACVAAVVVVCTTVSSVAADFDTETETAQTKMQQMKTEMHQLKMKMHLLQMKMQQIKMGETKTPKMKTPETPETKTPEMKAPEPKNPWDIAFGGALMSDFNFRGIAASDRRPAVTAYLEPRYNFTNSLQAYANIATYSLTLPNRVAAVVEMYGGVRPTFGRLALDFGFWEHWLPGGRCFNLETAGGRCFPQETVLYVNSIPAQISYWEVYAKATYYVDRQLSFGGRLIWTPTVLNSGAEATYVAGWAKYILPPILPPGFGWFISAEGGYWSRDKSPYPSYANWNAGLAFTWKQFILDLRYSDTNRHDCDVAVTMIVHNSNRCGASFIAKLSFDLTSKNLK